MGDSNPGSPAHFSLAGHFSADDIHEFLGVMPSSSSAVVAQEQQEHHNDDAPFSAHSAFSAASTDDGRSETPGDDIGEEDKAQARTERKRSREKQRRSDVNKKFADLTAVLRELEAEDETGELRLTAFSPTNRVDLIARTIAHLERMRGNNKRQKTEIDNLKLQLEQTKKAGEDTAAKLKEAMFNQPPQTKQVMMMVPMMMPTDGSNPFAAAGAAASSMPMMMNGSMMNSFIMPQPFMQPPPQQQHQQQQQQQQQHSTNSHGQVASQVQHSSPAPLPQQGQSAMMFPGANSNEAGLMWQASVLQQQQQQQNLAPQQASFQAAATAAMPLMMNAASGNINMNNTGGVPLAMPGAATTEGLADNGNNINNNGNSSSSTNVGPTPSEEQKVSGTSTSGGSSYAHCA